ncbi:MULTISPECIES: lipopolysaccharide heptosyltransferase I [Paraburkholderia]|uniref:lipopolysaccharide heptosyltransferase I n=1 Tax=Paraburkholderia TaxID=1822464 RepID=UPI002259F883|nr:MULTISPECIES: lipopolysaccharide heptosyltransferase I [Paraburkholderia]MCX4160889.1 lipopolysaccharide heptosyltransferase I [Paraburkholderia megapolitana]MDN7156385.1 lipopolysaccharide heptosyltransferase I [Paraburkholderia sp. CHISQ3]MDQ6493430.1 lipopolysaccharide heptosyltransferase I [Paraburkholderia megapolitana]
MKRILVVKVTSMGDVIQAQPVVADLKRAFPGVKVDWAADEAFAEIARWNVGTDRVLCAPLRRFKKARRWADFKAIWASIAELRAEHYDVVLDIHGVYKSAIISFLTRSSRRLGYQAKDLGERGAAFAYTGRFAPCGDDTNAWQGMRETVSRALGYTLEDPPIYNLEVPRATHANAAADALQPDASPLAILFHAASKDDKKWPTSHWAAVARDLLGRGYRVVLPWGSLAEHSEATDIVAQVPSATLLPQMTLTGIAQLIQDCQLVVGVDTGFVHLAHALQKRAVMIFIATSAEHFGNHTPYRSVSVGDGRRVPSIDEALQAIDHVHAAPPVSPASTALGATPSAAAA